MAALTASALVTDENLHAEFLFNPTVDRPNGQGVWATGVISADSEEQAILRSLDIQSPLVLNPAASRCLDGKGIE